MYVYHHYNKINAGINFTAQPDDVEKTCATNSENATFPCQFEGRSRSKPQWIINSEPYSSMMLPADHFYIKHTLLVTNISGKNGSTYQCQVVVNENGIPCAYKSTPGSIIIRCQGIIYY